MDKQQTVYSSNFGTYNLNEKKKHKYMSKCRDRVVNINEVALSSSRREAISLMKGSYKTLWLVVPRWILYQLRHKGSLRTLEGSLFLSSGSSRLRNQTGVSCIAGGFFAN